MRQALSLRATSPVHSQRTSIAVAAQAVAKIQPPKYAAKIARGANTRADAVRRKKFCLSDGPALSFPSEPGPRRF
jgi:hypothetical protein